MADNFSATVDAWVLESKQRMLNVFLKAVEITFEQVIDGTPVDTGFMRASWQASINAPLPLMAGRGVRGQTYPVSEYALTIQGVEFGDVVYGTYGANYATFVEYGANGRVGRGMVRLALQNWQANVNKAVSIYKDS